MLSNDSFVFVFIAVALFGILWYLWTYQRSLSMLQQWLDDNGYQLLHHEHRLLRRGPFFWTTAREQTVFYIEAVDSDGRSRKGYARCGSWWLGVFSRKVEVRWEA